MCKYKEEFQVIMYCQTVFELKAHAHTGPCIQPLDKTVKVQHPQQQTSVLINIVFWHL